MIRQHVHSAVVSDVSSFALNTKAKVCVYSLQSISFKIKLIKILYLNLKIIL